MKLSYKYKDVLGTGGYGTVFAASVTSSNCVALVNTTVAMKKLPVTNHVRHPLGLHEACALLLLRGHPCIPQVFAWGRSQYFEYVAMEPLGHNLAFTVHKFGLTLRNLIVLICQMLDAIQYIHEKGIIHCDVKTSNFVFGRGPNLGRLYLIDFGLCRPLSSRVTDPEKRLAIGTLNYCSERVLRGHAPARRDDMESLAYTIVHLLTGSLPWATRDPACAEFRIPPSRIDGQTLCSPHPPVFGRFVEYTRALEFAETPEYARWRDAFRELAPGLPEHPLFDTDDGSLPRVGASAGPALALEPRPGKDSGLIVVEDDEEEISRRVYGSQSNSGTVGFLPLPGSEWGEPTALSGDDVLGDELGIVAGAVELVEELPRYDRGRTAEVGCAEEVMNNAQSDSDCVH